MDGEDGGAAPIYYRRFHGFQSGLERYVAFGPPGSPPSAREQRHVLFPAANLRFANACTWNVGVGVRLMPATDKVTVKHILSSARCGRPSARRDEHA